MRIDLCRKCGTCLEVNKKYQECREPDQFFCHKCGNVTEEQIHSHCMGKEYSYTFLEMPKIEVG